MRNKNEKYKKIFEEIKKNIRSLDYGEVVVKIHDSRVVQVERIEKKRF